VPVANLIMMIAGTISYSLTASSTWLPCTSVKLVMTRECLIPR
jgi:hypothetical protein